MKKVFKKPLVEWVLEHMFHDDVDSFIIWNRIQQNGYSITTPCSRTAFEKLLRKYKTYQKKMENKF